MNGKEAYCNLWASFLGENQIGRFQQMILLEQKNV
jgi:hypothetical protein